MPVYKGTKTKDGRSFYFRKKYKDIFNMQKDYTSCKYLTKKEAEEAEEVAEDCPAKPQKKRVAVLCCNSFCSNRLYSACAVVTTIVRF